MFYSNYITTPSLLNNNNKKEGHSRLEALLWLEARDRLGAAVAAAKKEERKEFTLSCSLKE
jgi:hypothetical protein